jgi:hypothetical protein
MIDSPVYQDQDLANYSHISNEMLPDAEAFAKATMFNPLALVDGI